MSHKIDRSVVVEMLTQAAGQAGMTLDELYHQGRSDDLADPELRDIWLIWGGVLTADDLTERTNTPLRKDHQ